MGHDVIEVSNVIGMVVQTCTFLVYFVGAYASIVVDIRFS